MKQQAVALACLIGMVVNTYSLAQAPMPGQPTPGQPTPPAQPSQRTPPRAARPGEDPQKGTAVVRGYVVAADTRNPLRRALVNVRSQDGRFGGMTTTDPEGRFEVADLVGGRYTVSASKAGYVGMSYGQKRPDQSGTVLEIADGQLVEKIALSLPRGGVITGRVTDEFGDPIAGAFVTTHRFRYASGGRRLMPSGGSGGGEQTNDQGAFRIFGLPPGEYYVSASVRTPQSGAPNVQSTNIEGYAPTYFPGTPNASEAQRVIVKVAQETTDVSFSLIPSRLVRLAGRVVSSTGEPVVQSMIMLMPADRFGPGMMMGPGNAMTRADGSFQMTGVAAGSYNLSVRPRTPDANAEFGNMRITVGNDHIDNLLVVTSRGGIARGSIANDEGTPFTARPQQTNVFARTLDPELMMTVGTQSKVNDDWTFEITGLSDSRIITASMGDSPEWSMKAVYLNGQDVTDSPVEFLPGRTIEGFQILFSRKRTDLSGSIRDDRGRPQTDATVIVFAEDRARWTFATRYIRTARPDQDGRYSVLGMPPHDYFVIAVREIEPGQWQDPDFLETLRDQATRITLAEAETRVQDLMVAKQ